MAATIPNPNDPPVDSEASPSNGRLDRGLPALVVREFGKSYGDHRAVSKLSFPRRGG